MWVMTIRRQQYRLQPTESIASLIILRQCQLPSHQTRAQDWGIGPDVVHAILIVHSQCA